MSKENGKPDKTGDAADKAKAAGESMADGIGREAPELKGYRAYKGSSPEQIMADIERTRAHMDETLAMLGQRIRPRIPGKALGIALGALGLLGLGVAGYLGFRAYRNRPSRPRRFLESWLGRSRKAKSGRGTGRWRNARLLEQAALAGKLAMAARKGKPAIIVVEPRKL